MQGILRRGFIRILLEIRARWRLELVELVRLFFRRLVKGRHVIGTSSIVM